MLRAHVSTLFVVATQSLRSCIRAAVTHRAKRHKITSIIGLIAVDELLVSLAVVDVQTRTIHETALGASAVLACDHIKSQSSPMVAAISAMTTAPLIRLRSVIRSFVFQVASVGAKLRRIAAVLRAPFYFIRLQAERRVTLGASEKDRFLPLGVGAAAHLSRSKPAGIGSRLSRAGRFLATCRFPKTRPRAVLRTVHERLLHQHGAAAVFTGLGHAAISHHLDCTSGATT